MKALVTGAGGFLGSAVCRLLLEKGHEVQGLARTSCFQGIKMFQGDIANLESVMEATKGCDTVIHTAAKAGVWGPYQEYYSSNVTGTLNVIQACKDHGIKKLVYTSTPSVTYKGEDENGVNESEPYAEKFLCAYPKTKTIAEKAVLSENSGALATMALRPHLIWGPGDTNLVPRIIERQKAGKLRLIGHGSCLVDSVFIHNAAEAHLLAADKLDIGSPCSGKAYFITNGEPLQMKDLLNKICHAGGLGPIQKKIAPRAAYAVGAVLETLYKLFGKKEEPLMTRFVAKQLSTAHWFDISAAKDDLGYVPRISIDEGMKILKASF